MGGGSGLGMLGGPSVPPDLRNVDRQLTIHGSSYILAPSRGPVASGCIVLVREM